MDAITIRRLPDGVKQRLRMRAAANGRSMEAEARAILVTGIDATQSADLSWIERLIDAGTQAGGVELDVPADEPATVADLRSA